MYPDGHLSEIEQEIICSAAMLNRADARHMREWAAVERFYASAVREDARLFRDRARAALEAAKRAVEQARKRSEETCREMIVRARDGGAHGRA